MAARTGMEMLEVWSYAKNTQNGAIRALTLTAQASSQPWLFDSLPRVGTNFAGVGLARRHWPKGPLHGRHHGDSLDPARVAPVRWEPTWG